MIPHYPAPEYPKCPKCGKELQHEGELQYSCPEGHGLWEFEPPIANKFNRYID